MFQLSIINLFQCARQQKLSTFIIAKPIWIQQKGSLLFKLASGLPDKRRPCAGPPVRPARRSAWNRCPARGRRSPAPSAPPPCWSGYPFLHTTWGSTKRIYCTVCINVPDIGLRKKQYNRQPLVNPETGQELVRSVKIWSLQELKSFAIPTL